MIQASDLSMAVYNDVTSVMVVRSSSVDLLPIYEALRGDVAPKSPVAEDPTRPDALLLLSSEVPTAISSYDIPTDRASYLSTDWTFDVPPVVDHGNVYEAELYGLVDLTSDADGRIYMASGNRQSIWRVDPAEGVVRMVAGVPRFFGALYGGDGGPAVDASLYLETWPPHHHGKMQLDGNLLYIADTGNHLVRRVDLDTGIIERFAGKIRSKWSEEPGPVGDGGNALDAELHYPNDVAVGSDGEVYIAEDQGCVRVVYPDGTIDTFAGVCGEHGYDGDGGPPDEAHLQYPRCVETDSAGDVFICDPYGGNEAIRVVLR